MLVGCLRNSIWRSSRTPHFARTDSLGSSLFLADLPPPRNVSQQCSFSSRDSGDTPTAPEPASPKDAKPYKSYVRNTTILAQQRCEIQELPIVVCKIAEDEFISFVSNKSIRSPIANARNTSKNSQESIEEEMKINQKIEYCRSIKDVMTVLYNQNDANYGPNIAIRALEKILTVDKLLEWKDVESRQDFRLIINCIVYNAESKTILDLLKNLRSHLELPRTIDMLGNELVYRCAENALTIEECCDAIKVLTQCRRPEMAEKFWSGLADKEKLITERNIHFVFAMLPYLKISRRAVLAVLERRITMLWWQMAPSTAIEVMQSLVACKVSPFRVTQSMARWLNTNIHTVTEDELGAILEAFTNLSYSDAQIERGLERYMKAKGVKVTSQNLIITMLGHCQEFRLRNAHILNGCSEFLIANHALLEPSYFRAFFYPFGVLDFVPSNSIKFFDTINMLVDLHFAKIPPTDVIDIMFTFLCLERFPLNFVNRIFNPYFLDVLHAKTQPERMDIIRGKLKVFDTGLTLECADYDGPLLPRDHSAKAVFHDGRIKRIVNYIINDLEELAGGPECMTKFSVIQHLPVNSLYLVDVIFHPPGLVNKFTINTIKERSFLVAVLILLPEYYDSTGTYLGGSQVMRIRHLRRLGMKIVTLRFDTLHKLKIHPKELRQYLVERIKNAQEALPALKGNALLTKSS
ncbi:FAST kinase domain-containing protein 3, mitochondrial-like [Anopheles albimanus]|uniref:FAST kinase domain-containing protein 3, mitochondrial-like n=1 Tax=Anopheles albimanus TaxID=7167 RepID=UPI00163F315D|nr:FAST kinase domain-containing protein 3, mitochondrial-like [Anopheles albimanus]